MKSTITWTHNLITPYKILRKKMSWPYDTVLEENDFGEAINNHLKLITSNLQHNKNANICLLNDVNPSKSMGWLNNWCKHDGTSSQLRSCKSQKGICVCKQELYKTQVIQTMHTHIWIQRVGSLTKTKGHLSCKACTKKGGRTVAIKREKFYHSTC